MKQRFWLGVTAVPVILGLSFTAWVYVASERHLRSFPLPPPFPLAIPEWPAAVARGEHLARTRGCFGCHGEQLEGTLMWGYAVAPNLPALAHRATPATIEAAIRHGIGEDGRALYAMPSYNFVHLRDADVADLIAYLRSAPVVEKDLPEPRLPWTIRLAIALGQDRAMPAFLHLVPPLRKADEGDTALARGEYIAMTTCNECHGFGLRADSPWPGTAPDLIIVSAYSQEAFRTLMKSGTALGGRELDMMSGVARGRFAHFTDDEVGDLYAFLHSL
jgi:mono/diheme cytochrome c family protein